MRSLCNVKMVYLVNEKRINKRYVRLHYVLAVKKYRFGLRSEQEYLICAQLTFSGYMKVLKKALISIQWSRFRPSLLLYSRRKGITENVMKRNKDQEKS